MPIASDRAILPVYGTTIWLSHNHTVLVCLPDTGWLADRLYSTGARSSFTNSSSNASIDGAVADGEAIPNYCANTHPTTNSGSGSGANCDTNQCATAYGNSPDAGISCSNP